MYGAHVFHCWYLAYFFVTFLVTHYGVFLVTFQCLIHAATQPCNCDRVSSVSVTVATLTVSSVSVTVTTLTVCNVYYCPLSNCLDTFLSLSVLCVE